MKKTLLWIISIIAFSIAGCATSHVQEETKISDNELSCNSLQSEIDEAKRFEEQSCDENGITGTNVVAGLRVSALIPMTMRLLMPPKIGKSIYSEFIRKKVVK